MKSIIFSTVDSLKSNICILTIQTLLLTVICILLVISFLALALTIYFTKFVYKLIKHISNIICIIFYDLHIRNYTDFSKHVSQSEYMILKLETTKVIYFQNYIFPTKWWIEFHEEKSENIYENVYNFRKWLALSFVLHSVYTKCQNKITNMILYWIFYAIY